MDKRTVLENAILKHVQEFNGDLPAWQILKTVSTSCDVPISDAQKALYSLLSYGKIKLDKELKPILGYMYD